MTKAPEWGVRDPNKICWRCHHVQYLAYSDEGVLEGRVVECRERCVVNSTAIIGAIPSAFIDDITGGELWPQPFITLADGTKYWCTRWRQSELPIPAIPPEENGGGG